MTLEELLNSDISYQINAKTKSLSSISVKESLNFIKNGKFSHEINILRGFIRDNKLDYYKSNKTRLPAVTFSASFKENRNRSLIKNYNKLLVLDIDNLSEEQMVTVKEKLRLDDHILAYWESPSKAGIKGLVYLDYDTAFTDRDFNTSHTFAFRTVQKYFLDVHDIKLDASGSDITRLCFFSYDQNLFIRAFLKPFNIIFDKEGYGKTAIKVIHENLDFDAKLSRNKMFNPLNRNKPQDRKLIGSIVRYLKKSNKSITYDYHQWFQVAMSITSTFTYELGPKIFQSLSKLDTYKYSEDNCKEMLDYCYQYSDGSFTFGTIIHFAQEVGYKKGKEVPKVEVIL